MSVSDAQRKARDKWLKEKVEDVKMRVPKGQRAVIQEHAKKCGESVNVFLNRAVAETIERDNSQVPSSTAETK